MTVLRSCQCGIALAPRLRVLKSLLQKLQEGDTTVQYLTAWSKTHFNSKEVTILKSPNSAPGTALTFRDEGWSGIKVEMISVGNFSGQSQRIENTVVNSILSHLVTDRTLQKKNWNCCLMMYSGQNQKKTTKNPLTLFWCLSLGKREVSNLSQGRFCKRTSFPPLSCSLAQSISSGQLLRGENSLSVLLLYQQAWRVCWQWLSSWHCHGGLASGGPEMLEPVRPC